MLHDHAFYHVSICPIYAKGIGEYLPWVDDRKQKIN